MGVSGLARGLVASRCQAAITWLRSSAESFQRCVCSCMSFAISSASDSHHDTPQGLARAAFTVGIGGTRYGSESVEAQ